MPLIEQHPIFWSGWQDSNLRPPAPKAGAITGLRYTPKKEFSAERLGLEPRQHLRADRLAICSVTTPAPLLFAYLVQMSQRRVQKYFLGSSNTTFLEQYLLLRVFDPHVVNVSELLL